MLMSALRDKIKIVILVTLLAFVGLIFFDWGMQRSRSGAPGDPGGVLGEVNGEEIPFAVYRQTRQNILANFEARVGRTAEFSDYDAIEDETWLAIIQDMVVQQQIARYGISISDEEIMEVLRTNPPQFLRAHPDFTDDAGQFDPVRYNQALADPNFNWLPVENYIRAVLPTDKVQNYVGLNARVTSAEIRDRFVAFNEKVTARYVQSTFAGAEIADDAIQESDLREYFDSHPDEFRVGRQAVLEIVRVSKAPSTEDTVATRQDLEDIRGLIVAGGDFADNARNWSDDPSAERGGDLGFISPGDMPKPFEDVAFSTEIGQVSGVFETPFGFHVLKVEEKKAEGGQQKVRVRHILLRVEASNSTLRAAGSRMDDFLEEVEAGTDFAAAATQLGHGVETSPPFERGTVIPGLGLLRGAHRFAFASGLGAHTVDPVEDDEFLYAFRLVEIREPRLPAFEEVSERLDALVRQEERRKVARAKLVAAVDASDGSLESIAEQLGGAVDTTVAFARQSFVPGIGRRNAFIATAFRLPVGEVSGVVESDRGFYVLHVTGREPVDEAAFVEQRDVLRRQILQEKRAGLIAAWVENLILEAEIIDYRSGKPVRWQPDPDAFAYSPGA